MIIDLHTHSTASDGTDSPAQLLARAAQRKLSAIALTDHDTVAGLAAANEAAAGSHVELINGIEISTALPGRSAELHVLGYFINPDSPALERLNELLLGIRHERNRRLLVRLDELGVPVPMAELAEISTGVITRAHICDIMIRRKYVASVKEAFDRYLGINGLAYVEKGKLSFPQAFDVIHSAGGLVAIAHPVHLRVESDVELEILIGRLVDSGADAIEAFHPDHSPAWVRKVQRLAKRFNLCITGGSDYHGMERIARPLGSQRVAAVYLDKLKERLAKRRGSA